MSAIALGTLRVNPVTASGGFVVSNGATLAVNSGDGAAAFSAPTLALGDATSTLRFELNTASVPSGVLVTVTATDGLTTAGSTLALVNQQGLSNGTYNLIDYTGNPITTGFTLKLPGRTAGTLNYDTGNTLISATITGSDTIKWTGAVNSVWDVGTAAGVGGTNNWQLVTGGTPTNFIDTDTVTFDDTAGVFNVTLNTTVAPTSVTVNNSTNAYTISGSGKISGAATLTKLGTNTLTLATDNDYAGLTTVTAGTLQVGDGGTTGSITGPVSLGGGTLTFDRSNAVSLPGVVSATAPSALTNSGTGTVTVGSSLTLGANDLTIGGAGDTVFVGSVSGTGIITKTGAGTTTFLGSSNSFTGTATINAGVFRVADEGGGGDFGAVSIVVNNGGKFEFVGPAGNSDLPAATVITLNTGGVAEFTEAEDYGGIVLRGGAYNTGVNNNLGLTSTFESGTIGSVGGVNGSLAGAGLIEKTTSGTVTITGVALNNTGGLNIDQGVLSTDSAIGGSGTINFGAAGSATLQYRGPTGAIGWAVALGEGGGVIDITQSETAVALSAEVSGIGTLTKQGPGTLVLTGNNTYQGGTTISGGMLLANGQTAGNSGTGTGAVTVGSGGTLGGSGRVAGSVSVQDGGTVRAGDPTSTTANTLTLGSGLTVDAGATLAVGVLDGSTPAAPNTGGSSVGTLPDPTSNSFFNITGGTTSINAGANVVIDGTGTTFTVGQAYSYQIAQGAGDQSALSITNQARFTAVGFTAENFSLTGNSSGAIFVNFTPTPEPGTVLAIAAAALGLGGVVRRRLRNAAGATTTA